MSTIWSLYSKEIFNTIIMASSIISHKVDFIKHLFTSFVFISNTSISIVFNKISAIQYSQCNMLECKDRILELLKNTQRVVLQIHAFLLSLKSTLVKKTTIRAPFLGDFSISEKNRIFCCASGRKLLLQIEFLI